MSIARVIRRRPGMFLGTTDARGLHRLIDAFLDRAFPARTVSEGASVLAELSAGRLLCLRLRGGASFAEGAASDLFAVISHDNYPNKHQELREETVAKAVCGLFRVSISRHGVRYSQDFGEGRVLAPMSTSQSSGPDETTFVFCPDPIVFGEADFSFDALATRFQEFSYLHPGLTLKLSDRRSYPTRQEEFIAPDGIAEHVHFLNRTQGPLHPDVIVLDGADEACSFRVAYQWTNSTDCITRSFANNYETKDGGSHLAAFLSGVARIIRKYGREWGVLKDEAITREHCCAGLTAVVVVEIPEPLLLGATRSQLFSPEAELLIDRTLNQWFAAFLESQDTAAVAIARHALAAYQTDQAAKQARRQARANRTPRRGRP